MTQKEQQPAGQMQKPTASSRIGQAARKEKKQESGSGEQVQEIGGPRGPEPTRYGDWERNGRCIDF